MSGKIEISRGLAERLLNFTCNEEYDELRALLTAPVVERQRNQCDGCQAGKPLENGNRHRMSNGQYPDFMACTAKLYTSPPAPVSVVLPERKPQMISDSYARGWNDCINMTKELNQ